MIYAYIFISYIYIYILKHKEWLCMTEKYTCLIFINNANPHMLTL